MDPPTTTLVNPPVDPNKPTDSPKPSDPPKVVEPAKIEPLTIESVKIPDGFDKNEPALAEFVTIMNNTELKGPALAQALIDLQAKTLKEASEKGSQAFTTLKEQWATEAKADPEFGGAKLDGNLAQISKLIDQVGTPKLREVMDITGAGNHPEMIRFLTKVAVLATESKMLPAGSPPDAAKSQAARMFPNMKE